MSFEFAQELGVHKKKMHGIKTVMIISEKSTSDTIKKKKDGKSFQCYLCKTNYHAMKELRIHMKSHERDQKCEICKMELTHSEIGSHLCGEEKSIRCDYCAHEFTATSKLIDHLEQSHETKKHYECEKCPKFLSSLALREYHMKSHDFDAPKRFICEICSKSFPSKVSLNAHTKIHDTSRKCK